MADAAILKNFFYRNSTGHWQNTDVVQSLYHNAETGNSGQSGHSTKISNFQTSKEVLVFGVTWPSNFRHLGIFKWWYSWTGRPINFVFGSRMWFSRSAKRMAYFRFDQIQAGDITWHDMTWQMISTRAERCRLLPNYVGPFLSHNMRSSPPSIVLVYFYR